MRNTKTGKRQRQEVESQNMKLEDAFYKIKQETVKTETMTRHGQKLILSVFICAWKVSETF